MLASMNCNAHAAFEYLMSVVRSRLSARVILAEPCGGCAAVHTARGGAADAGPAPRGTPLALRPSFAPWASLRRHVSLSVLSAIGSVLRANHYVSRETACVVTVHI